MTRLPSSPESSIDAMCRAFMRGSVRSPRTIRFYRETCRIVANVLREGGRRFSVGDTLSLLEYTDHSCSAAVTHIIRHGDFPEGVPEGYAVLSLRVV